jgi:hypothetical protein
MGSHSIVTHRQRDNPHHITTLEMEISEVNMCREPMRLTLDAALAIVKSCR